MRIRCLISFAFLILLCVQIPAQTLNVATWNIRMVTKDDSLAGNIWEFRAGMIEKMIRFYDFDVFGLQEDYYRQIQDLSSRLSAYDYVGWGNRDGRTEGAFNAIFYKKDLLSVLDKGFFWISPTEDIASYGWDAKYIHSCTWAHFRIRNSGRTFWAFNLHGDYAGPVAQRETSRMMLDKIRKQRSQDEPVVLTGDFNENQKSEGYRILAESGVLHDSFDSAQVRMAPNGSFNAFDTDRYSEDRIDHIFISNGTRVLRYGVLTDSYWYGDKRRQPSDHYPVVIQVKMEK